MAGLVPAIHVLLAQRKKKDVDARHKAGHDGVEHDLMNTSAFVLVGVLITAFTLAFPSTAQPQSRVPPWCAYMGGQFGFDCGFYSYQQCMETARGLGNFCAPNPRYLASPRSPRKTRRARNR